MVEIDEKVPMPDARRFARGTAWGVCAVVATGALVLAFILVSHPQANHPSVSPSDAGAVKSLRATLSAHLIGKPAVPTVVTPTLPVTEPSLSALVTDVDASGIEPGSNWTWSIGDTSTHCGVIRGAGTGCTYGTTGREYTVFAGTPTLALVAHELANAETQNDAIPSLLNEVSTAAAGTSWSPTDAVASCLVAHFMGFQDNAAGAWQCPASLATFVAAHIHDTY